MKSDSPIYGCTALRRKASNWTHTLAFLLWGLSIPLYFWDRASHEREKSQFSEALEAADAGRWYWDLRTDEIRWDDQMFRLFGRDRSAWTPDYAGFEACIHPDDRERVLDKVQRAIAERGGYRDTFRVITSAGDTVEIRASGLVSRDGSYMTGINLPVTPREGNFITERTETGSGLPFVVRYADTAPSYDCCDD